MKFDNGTKILIVGLGLIGGSYAQALKGKGFEVGAIDMRESAISFALENGLISHGKTEVGAEYISQFDLIVFALYPHTFVKWIKSYQQFIKPHAIITDVTGVKRSVVYEIQSILREDVEFIAAHPMAGRELSGVENADCRIFKDANYIVTPTDKNTDEAVSLCKALGHTLGFKNVSVLSPEKHDEMIGFLSQLTHCIAVALMASRDSASLINYTGDSFRDLTRIAKINDAMWSELFMLNRDELLRQMDMFESTFAKLRDSIASGDTEAVREMMRLSTARREFFDSYSFEEETL